MSRIGHLAARFFGSLRVAEPSAADVAWVRSTLTAEEYACWATMDRADRVEAIGVGAPSRGCIGRGCEPRWLAAALLHDVGKVDAGLGPFRRVGRDHDCCARGARPRAALGGTAIGRYIAHDDRGAARLRAAGARPETAAWAAAHHRPDLWAGTGIPRSVCAALAVADGEPTPG